MKGRMTGTRKQIGKGRTASGFTLVELIVSIGVFSIMATSLTASFTSGFSTFGNSREIQHNVEAAQYSMNTLAKYLRTSTVVDAPASGSSIRFYDYSSKRCFEYQFNAGTGTLQARWAGIATITNVMNDCTASVLGAWQDLTPISGSYVSGRFYAVPSSKGATKAMGRVTMTVSVKKSASSSLRSDIQTSVSLRDYDYVGKTP
jgi:prepilin-type N-terminal cleavage/methylation domain-containing protein